MIGKIFKSKPVALMVECDIRVGSMIGKIFKSKPVALMVECDKCARLFLPWEEIECRLNDITLASGDVIAIAISSHTNNIKDSLCPDCAIDTCLERRTTRITKWG